MSRRKPTKRSRGALPDPNRRSRADLPVLPPSPSRAPETVSARVELKVGGRPVGVAFEVPAAPVPPEEALPAFRALTDAIVADSERRAEQEGRTVSCRKGCGACCRQLVPITEVEARALRDLIDRLPEPRRSEVLGRFAEARNRLEEAGLLETLLHPERTTVERRRELGPAYFRLGIPCPMLEDESCSIHPERPLACREYLVTSPAEHCSDPSPERIRRVELPIVPSASLARFGSGPDGPASTWVALIVAPEWAASRPTGDDGVASPTPIPTRPGPERVRELFRSLAGPEAEDPPSDIDGGRSRSE